MSKTHTGKTSFHKIISLLLAVCFCVIAFSGCASIDSEPYGKERVLKKVASEVPREDYELVSVEQIAWEPADVEYTFKSKERDFTFTANSCIDNFWFDGPTSIYYRAIHCHYESDLLDLYTEKIGEYQQARPGQYGEYWTYIDSFAEIQTLARNLFELSDIISEELSYNDREFIEENLGIIVQIFYGTNDEDKVSLCYVEMNGLTEEAEFYDDIANAYAQNVADGDIPDNGDIPEEYKDSVHVSRLENFYLNGVEMTYDELENPFTSYGLSTDDFKHSWYDFDLESYMMIIDTGYYSEASSFPLIIAEYVEALGGTWEMTAKPGKRIRGITWSIGDDTWLIKSVFLPDEPYFKSITLRKNGKRVEDFDYLTQEYASNIGATFCVAIPVDQFAALFNLDYEIDEASAAIYFTSK